MFPICFFFFLVKFAVYDVDGRKENIGESERETLKHTKARYKALILVLNVSSFVIFNFYKTNVIVLGFTYLTYAAR